LTPENVFVRGGRVAAFRGRDRRGVVNRQRPAVGGAGHGHGPVGRALHVLVLLLHLLRRLPGELERLNLIVRGSARIEGEHLMGAVIGGPAGQVAGLAGAGRNRSLTASNLTAIGRFGLADVLTNTIPPATTSPKFSAAARSSPWRSGDREARRGQPVNAGVGGQLGVRGRLDPEQFLDHPLDGERLGPGVDRRLGDAPAVRRPLQLEGAGPRPFDLDGGDLLGLDAVLDQIAEEGVGGGAVAR